MVLRVFFQVNSLLFNHHIYPLICQWTHPVQHPAEIQHNHHLTNLLGYQFFFTKWNTSRKPSQRPSKIPTVLQIFKPSGTPSSFNNQQPSGVPNLLTDAILSKKPSYINSSRPIYQPSDSPPVAVILYPSPLPTISSTAFS